MPPVLFDATRLARRDPLASPTGIDRVVLAYAEWLLSRADIAVTPVVSWGAAVAPIGLGRFETLVRAARAAHAASEGAVSARWPALEAALRDGAGEGLRTRPEPAKGRWLAPGLDATGRALRGRASWLPRDAIYLNVAHVGFHRPASLPTLKAWGVRSVVMLHDLIPINYPELCTATASARHEARLKSALRSAAGIITNSRATADDLAAYAHAHGEPLPPVTVALLGIEPGFNRAVQPLDAPPYFVCVGTLEARKNLAFLLTVWRRLAERLGQAAPRLVLVGRRGWENEAVVDHLERSPPLRTLVHEVSDLTDGELARLMAGARAVLAPSLAEGFDLPALEALAAGAPLIASDIAVHRELAVGARLVDPLDGPGWLTAIEAAMAGLPASAFRPPTWTEHFRTVAAALGLGAADG